MGALIVLLWLRAQGKKFCLCSWQVEVTQLHTLFVCCSRTSQRCSGKVEKRSEMEMKKLERIWGTQGTTNLLQLLLKATLTLQDDFRKSLSRKTRDKCWPHCYMPGIQLGFGLVAGFTAILLLDLASPDKPEPWEWMQEAPQYIHLDCLQLARP